MKLVISAKEASTPWPQQGYKLWSFQYSGWPVSKSLDGEAISLSVVSAASLMPCESFCRSPSTRGRYPQGTWGKCTPVNGGWGQRGWMDQLVTQTFSMQGSK